jgi:hypothetical protein
MRSARPVLLFVLTRPIRLWQGSLTCYSHDFRQQHIELRAEIYLIVLWVAYWMIARGVRVRVGDSFAQTLRGSACSLETQN